MADVTSRLALNQAIAELAGKLGPVDMLIACAGIGTQTSALSWNAAEFEAIVQVNLIGVANSIAAVMPGMIQHAAATWSRCRAWLPIAVCPVWLVTAPARPASMRLWIRCVANCVAEAWT